MADRYEEERRRRRENEARANWREDEERYWQTDRWRGSPYNRWEDENPPDRAYGRSLFSGGQSGRGGEFESRYRRDRFGAQDYDRGYGGRRYRGEDYGRGSERSGYDRENFGRLSGRGYEYNRWSGFEGDLEDDWEEDFEEPLTWTYTEYWWIPGPFTGIGPRGYQRPDERILEDLSDRLAQHGQIDASEMDLEVKDGEVTLTGTVQSRREKRMAEDIAESVFGVVEVMNHLRVQESSRGRLEGDRMRTGRTGASETRGTPEMAGMQGQSGMQGQTGDQIHVGMEVVGRDGERIGEVKEMRGSDFLVDRPMARDVYVPMSSCRVEGGKVQLNIRAAEVNDQGWEQPEILGTAEETPGWDRR